MDFDPYPMVIKTEIPNNGKAIVDIAPVNQESQSIWLMLAEDGGLLRFDAHSGQSELIDRIQLPTESAHDSFAGHALTRRLQVRVLDGLFFAHTESLPRGLLLTHSARAAGPVPPHYRAPPNSRRPSRHTALSALAYSSSPAHSSHRVSGSCRNHVSCRFA